MRLCEQTTLQLASWHAYVLFASSTAGMHFFTLAENPRLSKFRQVIGKTRGIVSATRYITSCHSVHTAADSLSSCATW